MSQSTYESNVGEKNINVLSDYLHLLSNPPGENVIVCRLFHYKWNYSCNVCFPYVFLFSSRLRTSFFTTPVTCWAMERLRGIDEWVPLSWAIFDLASICPRNRITVASTHEESELLLVISSRYLGFLTNFFFTQRDKLKNNRHIQRPKRA